MDNPIGILLLVTTILGVIVFINYLFPAAHIIKVYIKKEKEKDRKRQMIQQIIYQKEIDEEIEKEL